MRCCLRLAGFPSEERERRGEGRKTFFSVAKKKKKTNAFFSIPRFLLRLSLSITRDDDVRESK